MSADNALVVARMEDRKEYGIFMVFGDNTPKRIDKYAEKVYANPIHAILEAHKLQQKMLTEYGVRVTPGVIFDCRDFYPSEAYK